jgi:hypothetical protein
MRAPRAETLTGDREMKDSGREERMTGLAFGPKCCYLGCDAAQDHTRLDASAYH